MNIPEHLVYPMVSFASSFQERCREVEARLAENLGRSSSSVSGSVAALSLFRSFAQHGG